MSSELIKLFSCPLIKSWIDENTDELKDDRDCTVSYNSEQIDSNNPIGGQRVLERYPRIKEILLNKFLNVAEEYIGFEKKDYMITTSWLSLTGEGQFSQIHNHRNSFWSGVYYFQDDYPEGTSKIQFINPLSLMGDYFYSEDDIENLNEVNALSWSLKPHPKMLIFFPSYLQHKITKNNNKQVRSSLAFNISPLGKWGAGDSSYNTSWIYDNA